jgi:RNA polymerase sigma factor (sigma-70 family)
MSDGLTEGWAELYAAIEPSAMGFAFALCASDRAQAEDVFHDAFLRCARRPRLLDDRIAFERYLRRSMVNALIDRTRRLGTHRRWLQRQPAGGYEPDLQNDIATRDGLVQALRQLPARQRAAVVIRTCLDLSEAEAAAVLGCSVGNVKSLTSRGLAALRILLESEGSSHE